MAKKEKLVTTQLFQDTKEYIKQATIESRTKESRKIGHKFTKELLGKMEEMIF